MLCSISTFKFYIHKQRVNNLRSTHTISKPLIYFPYVCRPELLGDSSGVLKYNYITVPSLSYSKAYTIWHNCKEIMWMWNKLSWKGICLWLTPAFEDVSSSSKWNQWCSPKENRFASVQVCEHVYVCQYTHNHICPLHRPTSADGRGRCLLYFLALTFKSFSVLCICIYYYGGFRGWNSENMNNVEVCRRTKQWPGL